MSFQRKSVLLSLQHFGAVFERLRAERSSALGLPQPLR
jgi:hypothetical protein